jgi:hypothetical protein
VACPSHARPPPAPGGDSFLPPDSDWIPQAADGSAGTRAGCVAANLAAMKAPRPIPIPTGPISVSVNGWNPPHWDRVTYPAGPPGAEAAAASRRAWHRAA